MPFQFVPVHRRKMSTGDRGKKDHAHYLPTWCTGDVEGGNEMTDLGNVLTTSSRDARQSEVVEIEPVEDLISIRLGG